MSKPFTTYTATVANAPHRFGPEPAACAHAGGLRHGQPPSHLKEK